MSFMYYTGKNLFGRILPEDGRRWMRKKIFLPKKPSRCSSARFLLNLNPFY